MRFTAEDIHMKQIVKVLIAVVCVVIVMQPAFAADKPTLRWVGCGISKKAYVSELAKAYEKRTGVKIDIQGGGATRGVREVAGATADIGGSCRNRIWGHEEEKGVMMVPVAWDALAVIVHKDNPVEDISLDDLRRVYLGEIKNWKELGGPDRPILLYARDGKISGVGRTIRKLLFADYEQEFAASEFFPSTGPLEKQLVGEPDAIAMTGISSARKRDVKILKLEGKYPSYENVKNGEYLLYRPLYLVYNANNPNVEAIKDFIKFADSEEGQDVIRANGTVPYLEAMHLMRRKLAETKSARRDGGLR
jgi:phosphate transport system substrate-binding protein